VKHALDVLEVHEDGSILLLDEAGDASMVEHGTHPEPWNSQWCVLNLLNIACGCLNFFVVLIIKLLCSSLIGCEEVCRWDLLSLEDQLALYIDLLVKFVVLELESAVQSLFLVVKGTFLILHCR